MKSAEKKRVVTASDIEHLAEKLSAIEDQADRTASPPFEIPEVLRGR